MPNMSYCQFENTLKDLKQCHRSMVNDDKLSESEQQSKDELIKLCLVIVSDTYPDINNSEHNPLNY
jgi:hypothetical protein